MKTSFAAAIAMLIAFQAQADDRVPPLRDALTQKECGQCHMAFQPGLLPAQSWDRMMGQLDRHFGDNASLSPEKTQAIRQVLMQSAGRSKHGDAPDRITETRWFVKEHRFPDQVWKRPDVVSKSNCPACHKQAEAGIYEDH